jgi:hypothetical protein
MRQVTSRRASLVALALFLGGCGTKAYTNPARGDDKAEMQGLLNECEKESQLTCGPNNQGYQACFDGKVKNCMRVAGWREW